MAITKSEYLDAEKRIRILNQAVFVQKDEASATRIIISASDPQTENVAWVKITN